MLGRLPSILPAAGLAFAVVACATPSTASAADANQRHGYIVQLEHPPVSEYEGGTAGIPATSPRATGRAKVDSRSAAAARYRSYLAGRQAQALDRVAGRRPTVRHAYRTAFAGFSAALTSEQAKELAAAPEVAGLWRTTIDELSSTDDDLGGSDPAHPALGGDGPAWLRLTAPSLADNPLTGVPGAGLWSRIGGGPLAADGPGDGMVVGDLDSGISPGHPSFASSPGPGTYPGAPFGPRPSRFTGTCDPGDDPTFPACSNKIVAARHFVDGMGPENVLGSELPLSPRDNDGHGSHTAGIAAGNYGVQAGAGGARISGIAPRARIAVYKVCWQLPSGQGPRAFCSSDDVVAGIDQAVADGVDVLNHSIGGPVTMGTPKQLAFLGAYRAGVFVAASAGNDGPGGGTYGATPSPWTTVVAASTTNRTFRAELTLSGTSGLTVTGASFAEFADAPLVDAASPSTAFPDGTNGLCMRGTLDRAAVAGKVVLCTRGTNDRVEKSAVVKDAGGVGMVLGNTQDTSDDTVRDPHTLPSVHVNRAAHAQIKAALAAGPHRAELRTRREAAVPADGTTPRIAGFSSRGPVAGAQDLPGPDVTAPGVAVLAATVPDHGFASFNGTSMSAPHVAGAALLLRQRHPQWRPEQIKSALSTTANPDVKAETGDARASGLDVGSGQIDPNRADDPGLVVIPSIASLEAYLEAPAATAGALNLPAIVAWNMVGRTRTARTFTSVDAESHRWTISTVDPPDTAVTTSPAVGETITVAPGASTAVDVTITSTSRDGADVPRSGELRLTDENGRTVRLPITVRPKGLVATDTAIRGEDTFGSRGLTVTPAHFGAFSAKVAGVTGPTVTRRHLAGNRDSFMVPLEIPVGTPGLLVAQLRNISPSASVFFQLHTADANGAPVQRVATSSMPATDPPLQWRAPHGGRFVLVVEAGVRIPEGGVNLDLYTWNTSAPTGDTTLRLEDVPTGPVTAGDRLGFCAIAERIGPDQYYGLVSYHESTDGSGKALGTSIVDIAGGTPKDPCVVAPDTTIDSGPSDPSSSDAATFAFSANQAGVTYECRLDDAPYAACTSPHPLTALSDGRHTFAVRAANSLFTDPSPATFSWTVDTFVPAPDTTIDTAPGPWTNDASATFTFSSPDGRTGTTFECRLDDAVTFAPCSSPYAPTGLEDGPHRLQVRAVVPGATDATPALHAWNLDRAAPSAPTITGAPAATTTDRSATLTWTGEPDGGFACRRGEEPWTPCASPIAYGDLPLGPQSFAVRQTDRAGNVGTAARVDWTVSALPPLVIRVPAVPALPVTAATTTSVVVPATIGARGRTIPVGCRVDRGTVTRCTVVARLRGRVVGRGSADFRGVRSGEVAVRLTDKGVAAIRRLGGARLHFRTTVTAGGKRLTASRRAVVRPARTIVIPAGGLFASDSSRLTAAGRRLAARVRSDLAHAERVTCVGHTDARGPAAVNERLGLQRATAVCAALRGRTRVPVRSASAGASRPRATNRTAAGRASNRRVEIVVAYR